MASPNFMSSFIMGWRPSFCRAIGWPASPPIWEAIMYSLACGQMVVAMRAAAAVLKPSRITRQWLWAAPIIKPAIAPSS